jgi:hypothetical protein
MRIASFCAGGSEGQTSHFQRYTGTVMIDPVALSKLQGELASGESLKWAGRPASGFRFHFDDWKMVAFGLGLSSIPVFAIKNNWSEWRGWRPYTLALLFAVFAVGQFAAWGSFLYDGWLKRRTYYGVTPRRIIVLQEAWSRGLYSTYLEAIQEIEQDGANPGTLWFGPKLDASGRSGVGGVTMFSDINDSHVVFQLVMDLRQKVLDEQKAKP